MIHIEHSIQVGRPRNEVFDYLTHIPNLTKWQTNVVDATAISEGPMAIGFQFEQTVKLGPRQIPSICTVTDIKTNERFAFAMASDGPVDCDAHFDLQPVQGGTRITLDGEARLKGLWRLLHPIAATELKSETKKELETIKRLLESTAPVSVR
jgi:hypothetical protein